VRAGWRAEQTSNAYELVPAAAEIQAAQAALAQRRAAVEARLLGKGMGATARAT
jgi:hypothetical protein